MGYLKIPNAYRPEAQHIFLFKELYSLEKIHGSSAHISFKHLDVLSPTSAFSAKGRPELSFYAGGAKHAEFVKLFDEPALMTKFEALGHDRVMVHGEAYGGKMQGMSATYGKSLKFVAFDVRIGDTWLSVPDAKEVCDKLGLEFVYFEIIPATVEALDAARKRPSTQAVRNGILEPKMTEGVVVRPLIEVSTNHGRVIAKHKNPEFSERASKRDTEIDSNKAVALANAEAVAFEFVTDERMRHVLDRLSVDRDIKAIRVVMDAMVEDVLREGAGEFEDTKETRKAISTLTSKKFREMIGV